jgi:NADPH:quinone reductase-like Zn-dependent oxidoreductase
MKAVVYTSYGSPDVLQLQDIDKPVPQDHDVLIKVHATTVNRTDCGFRKPEPFFIRVFTGLIRPKRKVLGRELAGEIESVGTAVTSFKAGDQVFGLTGSRFGAHAQFVIVPEDRPIVRKPANLTYDESACIADGAMLALGCLRKGGIGQGKTILIYGASGSIGTAAVQLAKYFGADITAVCGTRNVELVRSLGADEVIDYTRVDFTSTGRTYDIVFDAVGKSTFRRCRSLLKPQGVYIATDLGFLYQNPFFVVWTSKIGTRKAILPIPNERKEDIEFFKQLIEDGHLRPVIDRRYPLEEIADAYRYVETGHKTGNVVITVRHDD